MDIDTQMGKFNSPYQHRCELSSIQGNQHLALLIWLSVWRRLFL